MFSKIYSLDRGSLYREAITCKSMGKKTGPNACVRYRENSFNRESLKRVATVFFIQHMKLGSGNNNLDLLSKNTLSELDI
jgi:hypothetical protein